MELRYYSAKKLEWVEQYDNVETLAGSIAVLLPMMADINKDKYIKDYYQVTDAPIHQFRVATMIDLDYIDSYDIDIPKGNYAVWVKDANYGRWNCYTFRRSRFLKGMMIIQNLLGLDLRDYLYDTIFDNDGQSYAIAGLPQLFHEEYIQPLEADDFYDDFDYETINQPDEFTRLQRLSRNIPDDDDNDNNRIDKDY